MPNLITGFDPFQFAESIDREVSSRHEIPNFVKGRYMILSVGPARDKTVRDGLVLKGILMSYKDASGNDVEMVTLTNDEVHGLKVDFPKGHRNLIATKFRGPKSECKYVDPETNTWKQIGSKDPATGINDKLTAEFAREHLSKTVAGFDTMSDLEKDMMIDEHLENMFSFLMSMDLKLDIKNNVVPQPGMIVDLYRRYEAPADGARFGRTIITKWAVKEQQPELDGSYKQQPPVFAEAITNALEELNAKRESNRDLPF